MTMTLRRPAVLAPLLMLTGCLAGVGVTPLSTGREAGAPGRRVYFLQDDTSAKLAYARPGSSDVTLLLQCQAHAGRVTVRTATPRADGDRLVLGSGSARTALKATAATSGAATLVYAEAPADAPAMQAFRSDRRLRVQYGRDGYTVEDRSEDRADTIKFLDFCVAR